MCDCQGFLFVTYCQHPPSELLVSKVKLLSFIMPRGRRKGSSGRGRGKGKFDHPLSEHKDSASDGSGSSDDQTKKTVASIDNTKMSSQNKAKIKSANAARKPKPENAETRWWEMSNI